MCSKIDVMKRVKNLEFRREENKVVHGMEMGWSP
jgi:hypothetical protein